MSVLSTKWKREKHPHLHAPLSEKIPRYYLTLKWKRGTQITYWYSRLHVTVNSFNAKSVSRIYWNFNEIFTRIYIITHFKYKLLPGLVDPGWIKFIPFVPAKNSTSSASVNYKEVLVNLRIQVYVILNTLLTQLNMVHNILWIVTEFIGILLRSNFLGSVFA